MLKTRNQIRATQIQKLPFFYGWVIVFLAAFAMFATTPGQSDTFAMFIDSFIKEFGWSRTVVSSMYASATLVSGLTMFLVGRLVDKFGSKKMVIASAVVLGVACFLLSFVISPFMLMVGFFLARLAGKGSLDLSASTLAPQWFRKQRALAIMLVGLGGTAGGMLFPMLNAWLIESFGWREAYRYLGAGLWLVFVPIILIFLINKPEDVNLLPDNEEQLEDEKEMAVDHEFSLTQAQALKTPAFWILTFAIFQASMIGTGIVLHFVSIFGQQGFSMDYTAKILGIKTFIGFATTMLAGLLLDKVKRQHLILAGSLLLSVVSYLVLAFLQNELMVVFYTVISGIAGGLMSLSVGLLKPNLFGRHYLGGISGVTMAINVIGSAIGPLVIGAAFDLTSSYQNIILLSTIFPLVAGISSLFIRKPGVAPIPEQAAGA
jgi:MFS family permease